MATFPEKQSEGHNLKFNFRMLTVNSMVLNFILYEIQPMAALMLVVLMNEHHNSICFQN